MNGASVKDLQVVSPEMVSNEPTKNAGPVPVADPRPTSPSIIHSAPMPTLVDPAIISASATSNSPSPAQFSSFVNSPGVGTSAHPLRSQKTHHHASVTQSNIDTEADDYDNSSTGSDSNVNVYTAVQTAEPFEPRPRNRRKNDRRTKRSQNFQQRGYVPRSDNETWATEDVTDYQDSEFDFQANLDQFDKASVFAEIRQSDQTLPGDRLVAFNKLPNSGGRTKAANGQINFGNREMVLEAASEWDYSVRDEPLYQEEKEGEFNGQTGASSMHMANDLQSRRLSRPQLLADSLEFISTSSKTACPCASPVQVVELDRFTTESIGIPQTVLIENAGRGIAQLAVKSLGGTSRFSYKNHNSRPLVVVFVGNSRTGARALAAARHLANRQVQVFAFTVGCIEEQRKKNRKDSVGSDAVLSEVRLQLAALESSKGRIFTRYDQFISEVNLMDSPVELVIDAFQGYQTTLDDLGQNDLLNVKSCVEWANKRQKSHIMAIDIPSGLDSATGLPYNKALPYTNAKLVISCGVPLTGIHNAYITGTVANGDWTHYVVDVGYPLGSALKGSLRRFGQIWFGAEWLHQLDVVVK